MRTKCLRWRPFTVILVVVIWYLSLFTPPHTQLDDVKFIDKWTHLLMYGSLVFVTWSEDWLARAALPSFRRAVCLYAGPVLMSGVIELVQAYCTTNRSGDWLDFAANSVGGLLGAVLAWAVCTYKSRK